MALNTDRLKGKFKTAYTELRNAEVQSEEGLDMLCHAMALSIIEEIQALSISYISGLSSPSGPVTGTFTFKLT
jgi:hypothetical protein